MKTAIICNTPFTLMNSINIVLNNVENSQVGSDLFIVDRFKDANLLVDNKNKKP